jgi:hypothetical protein
VQLPVSLGVSLVLEANYFVALYSECTTSMTDLALCDWKQDGVMDSKFARARRQLSGSDETYVVRVDGLREKNKLIAVGRVRLESCCSFPH